MLTDWLQEFDLDLRKRPLSVCDLLRNIFCNVSTSGQEQRQHAKVQLAVSCSFPALYRLAWGVQTPCKQGALFPRHGALSGSRSILRKEVASECLGSREQKSPNVNPARYFSFLKRELFQRVSYLSTFVKTW